MQNKPTKVSVIATVVDIELDLLDIGLHWSDVFVIHQMSLYN